MGVYRFLKPNTRLTNVLYWYTLDTTVSPSDFWRIGLQEPRVNVVRARDPENLTRLMGYFLEFSNVESAKTYLKASANHKICGFPLQLQFASLNAHGFRQPLLPNKRNQYVLTIGFSDLLLRQAVSGYTLAPGAVKRLPKKTVKTGELALIEFANETDARVFARVHSSPSVFCEVLD